MGALAIVYLAGVVLLVAVAVFVLRWALRVNAIHQRLEEIGVMMAELVKVTKEK